MTINPTTISNFNELPTFEYHPQPLILVIRLILMSMVCTDPNVNGLYVLTPYHSLQQSPLSCQQYLEFTDSGR